MISLPPLEQLLTATTFAEAGEFDTAREMLRAEREILLVVSHDPPQAGILATARSMMERLDAGVAILLAAPTAVPSADLHHFLNEIRSRGRSARVIHQPGISWRSVLTHAREVSGIVCILIESLEKWGLPNGSERRRPPFWSRGLPCPVVVARPPVH
ncbi:MAG: hypothetical protein H7834_09870 [Magnetococcus sp. YQC-9]